MFDAFLDFTRYCDATRLPDDVTLGYVISSLLNVELIQIAQFHSHLEPLFKMQINEVPKQVR